MILDAQANGAGVLITIREGDRVIRVGITTSEAEDFTKCLEDAVLEAKELAKQRTETPT